MLVVIAIILLIGSTIVGVGSKVAAKAQIARAQANAMSLLTAINAYFTEYGKWPSCGNGSLISDMPTLLDALMGRDGFTDLAGDSLSCSTTTGSANPRRVVFLTIQGQSDLCRSAGANKTYFRDPWGNAYSFAYDKDFNQTINNADGAIAFVGSGCGGGAVAWPTTADPGPVPRPAIVWSLGPDKANGWGSSTFDCGGGKRCGRDDIVSWR